MQTFSALLFVGLAISTNAWFGGGPDWSDLRVHWGLNLFDSSVFETMPRTTQDAVSNGFSQMSTSCVNGPFNGYRYMKGGDPAVILLFDVNGYIAGIQTMFDATNVGYTPSDFNKGHPFMSDGQYSGMTAYFVDPSTICTSGRSADDFKSEGTGTDLYIQNGTNPVTDALKIPMTVEGMGSTMWTEGKCFPTMGLHYWYNIRTDMSCNEFYPFFLLFNGGKLNGFGFAMNANIAKTPHYEHPTPSDAAHFIDPYPNCLKTDPSFATLSTMHVYFSTPETNFC